MQGERMSENPDRHGERLRIADRGLNSENLAE
jgi:hypothetical protein